MIPSLSMMGTWRLATPFDALVLPKVVYRCTALRKIEELNGSGIDPYAVYYKPHQVSESQYRDDVRNGVVIVTLQIVGTHTVIHVPSSFVTSMPSVEGVAYTAFALGIELGALPNDTDFSLLKTRITELVRDDLGVNFTPTIMSTSTTQILTQAEHQAIVATRKDLKRNTPTERARIVELERQLAVLRRENDALIASLSTPVPPPATP